MNQMLVPPRDPENTPIRPPMVYVEKKLKWEYKQIIRDLETEQPLGEAELNALGEEGWELAGIAQQLQMSHYYFKREAED